MGKCLGDNLGAMLKVALRDFLKDPPSEKKGRRDVKIGSMRSKGSLVLEKGCFKPIRPCLMLRGIIVSIEEVKSLSRRIRNEGW